MKLKKLSASLFFLLAGCIYASAGDVTVTPMSPGEAAYFMNNLSKISVAHNFNEKSTLVFYDEQGEVVAEKPVQGRTKITFGSQPSEGLSDVVSDNTAISFYPNPSTDFITIVGLQSPTPAKIYNLNGQLLISSMESHINVSNLQAGSYVLQVGSQCFKVLIQ